MFEKRLYTITLGCEIACDRKRVKSFFFDKFGESIRTNMRVYSEQYFREPFTELNNYADTLFKNPDKNVRAGELWRRRPQKVGK